MQCLYIILLAALYLTACGSTNDDASVVSAANDKQKFMCTAKFKQMWPKKSADPLPELEGYAYKKEKLETTMLELAKKPVILNESEMEREDKDRSVADSPNLNNFQLRLKLLPEGLAQDYCKSPDEDTTKKLLLEFETLVVVRDFNRNLTNSALYCVDPKSKRLQFNLSVKFGRQRKEVGPAQQANDDLNDQDTFESEAPAAHAEINCVQ